MMSKPYYGEGEHFNNTLRLKRRAPDPEVSLPRDKGGGSVRMPVVGKCCPVGQNISEKTHECAPSSLSLKPIFFEFNQSIFWDYDVNEWEAIVGNPCRFGKYILEPNTNSEDEFYLLKNGSLLAPFHSPQMLGPRAFCLEAFWIEGEAVALPLVCFTSPPPAPPTRNGDWGLAIAILMLLSVPLLVVTCVCHLCLRAVWESTGRRHARTLAAHCASLALAFSSLAITQLASHLYPPYLCVIAACTIQVTFFASFFWLSLLCYNRFKDIWYSEKSIVTSNDDSILRCCGRSSCIFISLDHICGWVIPLLMTLFTFALDQAVHLPIFFQKPNFGASGCWFQTETSTQYYFYIPVAILLGVNLLLYFASCWRLWGLKKPEPSWDIKTKLIAIRRLFYQYLSLALIMGLPWLLELASWYFNASSFVWYICDLINVFQGFIIFGVHMVPLKIETPRGRVLARTVLWRMLTKRVPWLSCKSPSSEEVVGMTAISNGHGTPV